MKALLICPSIRPAVPLLAEAGPLAAAPVLGGSVVGHWIEHLAMLGAKEVRIIAADRADEVRAETGDGARWGVRVEVVAAKTEPSLADAAQGTGEAARLPAPHDAVLMSHLPGTPGLPLFESYAAWYESLLAWLPRALTPTRVRVAEIRPGIWVGRRAQVSRAAELIGPCWIGDQVLVEPGAVIGPGAILEDRAVAERGARITQSWVGPDTFIGSMTAVADSLAWGDTLVNWRTDSYLRVPDPFLMCSLARPSSRPVHRPLGHPSSKPAYGAQSALNWKLPNPAAER
jgi:NDP-sugar pyrophosphorylase family protein